MKVVSITGSWRLVELIFSGMTSPLSPASKEALDTFSRRGRELDHTCGCGGRFSLASDMSTFARPTVKASKLSPAAAFRPLCHQNKESASPARGIGIKPTDVS